MTEMADKKENSNKKLSYRRDSARRRSLLRSWSFKVINVGTSRKPVCDLLLVNNAKLHPISNHFPVCSIGQIIAFIKRVPLVNTVTLGKVCEYRHKSHIAENRFFGLHFCHRQYGASCSQFLVVSFQM